MKKIININLSGRVIPIEDAAYESLQRYIESLRRYFANEEGRDEIINDIESRIAELMNEKVKKGAPAVTEADVEEIITAMGRVEDFEEAEPAAATTGTTGSTQGSTTGAAQPKPGQPFAEMKLPRGRLYRDSNDKMIGGVCAGIANYLNIDPALVRIVFVLLFFGAFTGGIIYLLLWIILPSKPLEAVKTKRLFRNPDDRILGGVAGGIGAYLNKEPWIIRLILAAPILFNVVFWILRGAFTPFHGNPFVPNFFIGSFSFTFGIIYVILWIILPEAKGTYDKMEMRGEYVDVNKIRDNVRTRAQSFGEEVKTTAQNFGTQAREFAGSAGRTATPEYQPVLATRTGCGYVIVLLLKIFIMFILGCFALFFFLLLIFLVFGGVGSLASQWLMENTAQNFLGWSAALLILGVPMMALITWLVRRIMKVRTHSRYLGWTFGSLWALGLVFGMLFAGTMIKSFRAYNSVPEDVAITQPGNKMIVTVSDPEIRYSGNIFNDGNDGDGWDIINDSLKVSNIDVQVAKSEDSLYHVTLWKYSRGRNRNEAEDKAKKITYSVSSLDSILDLSNGLTIGRDEKFRGQKVMVSIKVPVGKMIRFDRSLRNRFYVSNVKLRERVGQFRHRNDWDYDWDSDWDYRYNTEVDYLMNADGELLDMTQPIQQNEKGIYEYKRTTDTIEKDQNMQRDDQRDNRRDDRNDEGRKTDSTNAVNEKKAQEKEATAKIASPVFSMII